MPWEIAAPVLILGNAYVLRSRHWPNKRGCDSSSLRLCDGVVCGRAKHGWNGRLSNPDLEPEKAHNGEIIAMAQTGRLFHDASLYSSHDDDVIKEEAENAGSRAVWGGISRSLYGAESTAGSRSIRLLLLRLRLRLRLRLHLRPAPCSTTRLNTNVRANYVSERKLYSQNPLRAQGETTDAYVQINGAPSWSREPFDVTLKVVNLLDSDHFHPGVGQMSRLVKTRPAATRPALRHRSYCPLRASQA
jgi:hypothetical protein